MALTTESQSHRETQNSETQPRSPDAAQRNPGNAPECMFTRNTLRSFRATNSLVTLN